MSVLWLLAHFDDEYCAAPLILRFRDQGVPQRFLFLADYPSARTACRRAAETRAFLGHFDLPPDSVIHLGPRADALDGALIRRLPQLFQAVREATSDPAAVETLVAPAWEGGHPDHDACAVIAVRLQSLLPRRPPIRQFGLYHGCGLPGPLFRAGSALPENGPTHVERLSKAAWADYAGAVRFYPSQAPVWSTLWPALFAGFARHGFVWQALEPERVRERPHPGPLLYERNGRADYAELRARADLFLDASPPARAPAGPAGQSSAAPRSASNSRSTERWQRDSSAQ